MKQLILLRHAKSSKDDPTLRDIDRPLNERGLRDAPRMGEFFRKKKIRPDVVLCSPSLRTRQTAELFLKAARIVADIKLEPRVYEASSHELLATISACDKSVDCILLVGHNPSIESLFNFLAQRNEPMPTTALACFNLETKSWAEVRPEIARLEWYVKPKDLETI